MIIHIKKLPGATLPLFLITAASFSMPVVLAYDAFTSRADLRDEAITYCDDPDAYNNPTYGPIEDWNVQLITSMYELFYDLDLCNPDIGGWNVSSVKDFTAMFWGAAAFNQDLSAWDVSQGQYFSFMFNGAAAFNQDLSAWDVSQGQYFTAMFEGAAAFNQDLSAWDVSQGTDFGYMFWGATSFNQDLSAWDVSQGTDFDSMFFEATNFDQPRLYCNWKHKVEAGVELKRAFCIEGGTSCDLNEDCSTPSPTPAPTANGGGDPHFKTFNGKAFSYHGECDLVLMRSKSFDGGKGLSIHVRTTRLDNYRGAAYSYISAAAVQMENTVLEVSAYDGTLLVDGSRQAFVNDAVEEGGKEDILSFAAGYTLKRSTKGKHGLITVFDLNLGNEEKISIRCNTKSMMLFVDVIGYFEDSEGLLGAPVGGSEEGLRSRPNAAGHRFDMTGHWNSYGEEWQVLDTEPNLFQEKRFPQYPQGCVYESTKSFKKSKTMLRRRLLLDSVDEAALEIDARKACTKSIEDNHTNIMSQFCINDVMATGDLELAEDPFYHSSSTAE